MAMIMDLAGSRSASLWRIPGLRPTKLALAGWAPSYSPAQALAAPPPSAMGQLLGPDAQAFINSALSAMSLYEQTQGMDAVKLSKFKSRFTECEASIVNAPSGAGGALQIAAGIYCLKTLYDDVKDALDQVGVVPPPPPPLPPGVNAPFPWTPVLVVGGGLAVIGIITAIVLSR